jgi:hypothetical protein
MPKPKGPDRRLLVGVLAGLGAVFAVLAAASGPVPGGVFAGLSSLSWLGAVRLAARR